MPDLQRHMQLGQWDVHSAKSPEHLWLKLLRLRNQRAELRQGDHWYYANPAKYQSHGVMILSRSDAGLHHDHRHNFTDADATVPFTPPAPGQWTERLDGQASFIAAPSQEVQLTIPNNQQLRTDLDLALSQALGRLSYGTPQRIRSTSRTSQDDLRHADLPDLRALSDECRGLTDHP